MLAAHDVKKTYPVGKGRTLSALAGVTLTVEPGRTLAVVGESGCGKSTLAKLLLGLETPTEGFLTFRGQRFDDFDKNRWGEFRRSVQLVFQDPYGSLNPRMRVGDIVGEGFAIHELLPKNQRSRAVCELLARVGLDEDAARRYPREFSGGQRQRIGIARALAVSPQILVADEPVSALDVSVQAQILSLLQELREERGLGLLFISHDLRVVRAVADRTAVMYLGRVVEEASTESLFLSPRHPYTRLLLDSVPLADPTHRGRPSTAQGDPPSPVDRPPGCPFHPRCPLATPLCREELPVERNRPEGGTVSCHLA